MNPAPESDAITVGDCLRSFALREIDAAGRMLGRRSAALHRGVHEARKSIRHVRSTLRLGLPDLGGDARTVFAELKQLAETLSSIRDAHVAVQTLRTLSSACADEAERQLVERAVRIFARRRARRLASVQADDPALARRRALLQALHARIAALPWPTVSTRTVHAGLARSMERAKRLGERALDSRNGDLRHRWRRRLRRLRQQLKIVENELGWLLSTRQSWWWPDPASDEPDTMVVVAVKPKTLGALTDALGFEHDLRNLRASLRGVAELHARDKRRLRMIVTAAIESALS